MDAGWKVAPDRHPKLLLLELGLGKHFCIGYELARKEAVMGSEIMIEKLGSPSLGEGQTGPVIQGNSFFAVKELLVSFKS